VLTRLSWRHPRLLWAEFHDVLPPPARSKWPGWVEASLALLVSLRQVWLAASAKARPSGCEPVMTSWTSGLVAAFEHARGNQVRAARERGVARHMVRTLLKRHGLRGCEPPVAASVAASEGGAVVLSAV